MLKKFNKFITINEEFEGISDVDTDISILFVKNGDNKIFDDRIYVSMYPNPVNVAKYNSSINSLVLIDNFNERDVEGIFLLVISGTQLDKIREDTGLPFIEESSEILDPNTKLYTSLLLKAQLRFNAQMDRDNHVYPSFPPINM
tara:strand:- start:50350 stop:50781 length:432 start_codon:yes stop_codon:yes gene_type:complete